MKHVNSNTYECYVMYCLIGRANSEENEILEEELDGDLQEFDQELPIRHAVSFLSKSVKCDMKF